MPQLLLELFSEEIPARMQAGAARDLERMVSEHLLKAGLSGVLTSYAGPRRLTLVADSLTAATPDREEELKGPRTSAPDQALDGFLRKTGLTRDQLTERDGTWFAVLSTPGRATADIIAEMVPAIMASFPWPKSMRSGTSHFRWVRPLKRILCLFDGRVVPFEAGGIASGDLTEGHRFMGADHAPFAVTDFTSYQAALRDHYVLLDAAERRRLILDGARLACAAEGLELVEDEGLLDEVSGLSEWPTPILGRMDPAFLDLPAEVIRTSMRTHQKYFAVRDPKSGGLAPRFVVVANIEPQDGGAVIAAGNAKVLSARLNDARFFWDQDRAPGAFDKWLKKLKGVTFHAKLGTLAERVERIEALAREIAPLVGADPELAGLAARYCKADLASGMVGEFPELQGVMGGYYARAIGRASFDTAAVPPTQDDEPGEGPANQAVGGPTNIRHAEEPASAGVSKHAGLAGRSKIEIDQIADAIRDHYKPVGPSDSVPTAPVTVAVALADKLDTLVGFFAIDEKPTGSKDPYALRRAALGIIRLVREGGFNIELYSLIHHHLVHYAAPDVVAVNLIHFIVDRLEVNLRDAGYAPDVVRAAFATIASHQVRVEQLVNRVTALTEFIRTDDGVNLLVGYRRAAGILKTEPILPWPSGELAQYTVPEEIALAVAARATSGAVIKAMMDEDFKAALHHLAHLRAPVDAFFDKVMVNAPDAAVRMTRLRLLTQVRDTANRVADFSLISG